MWLLDTVYSYLDHNYDLYLTFIQIVPCFFGIYRSCRELEDFTLSLNIAMNMHFILLHSVHDLLCLLALITQQREATLLPHSMDFGSQRQQCGNIAAMLALRWAGDLVQLLQHKSIYLPTAVQWQRTCVGSRTSGSIHISWWHNGGAWWSGKSIEKGTLLPHYGGRKKLAKRMV